MSYVNVWIAIPEDDHNELNTWKGNPDKWASPARLVARGAVNTAFNTTLYKKVTQGQTTRVLWNVILNRADGDITEQIDAFRGEYPGCTVLGAWEQDGSKVDGYEIHPSTANYMPDELVNGVPVPNSTLRDVFLVAGFEPRDFS